jgi:competence protein ComFC
MTHARARESERGTAWQSVLAGAAAGLGRAVDSLFPPTCAACFSPLEQPRAGRGSGLGWWLCARCELDLPVLEGEKCRVCGEAFPGDLPLPFACQNCGGRKLAFDFATSAYQARDSVRDWIHQFKYQRRYEWRGLLGTLVLHAIEREPRLDGLDPNRALLVPVPMHWMREMVREYNHTAVLARETSALSGIPCAPVLVRGRLTTPQAGLDRRHRIRNLRGAIEPNPSPDRSGPDPAGRLVLLVDDVLTTGSTAHECARVLRRMGAEKVVVISAARG